MDQPYSGPNLGPLQGGPHPASDGWDAFPEAKASKADDWSAFPEAGDSYGMAKQTGVGVAKGAIGLAGLPGDAQQLAKKGGDWLAEKLPSFGDTQLGKFLKEESAKSAGGAASAASGDLPGSYELPTSHDIQGQVEKVTGEFRKPQNQKERDAETAGEFAVGLLGPGGPIRKLVTQVAAPAAATITAGRLSDQNPYVKALAGFVAGGVGAALSGPSSAENLLRSKLPPSVTEHDITRAGQLIDHAQARGVALTWPEALTRVTGQPVLTDTQRILESHGQTRPQMQEFFADRPAQVENAARTEFDRLGTLPASPSTIGPQAREVADQTLSGVRQQINHAAEPFYQAAEGVLLTPAEMSHVRAIPGWTEARDAVRNNPQIGWRVEHLPDNSVGFLNAVKKHFDQAAENSGSKFNPGRNKEVQSSNEMAASAVRQIGEAKSAEYQIALEIQRQGRQQFLEPLLQGPLGKLAKKDTTTQKAIDALFPENPVPGTEGEIRNAVYPLAQARPAVAEALVRAHVEMVFNQAARDLQGGANQFAGAKFAVKLAGGAQQRENLRAAIEALPNGTARWEGFEHLLDIMQATGARQPKGSLTEFNKLEIQSMSSDGLASLASKGASPGKYWTAASDAFKAWSLGHNLDQLARIITDPRSGDALRQIVRIPAGSDRALAATGRLIITLGASTTEQRAKPN
jgi:hypothetical protein